MSKQPHLAEIFQFARSSNSLLSPKKIRKLIEKNLGYSVDQIQISHSSGKEFIDLTISDPLVDVARVEHFAKCLRTWNADQGGEQSGQHIEVMTTRAVNLSHAAEFMAEAAQIAFELTQPGQSKTASNGAVIHCVGFDFFVYQGNEDGGPRYYGGERDSILTKTTHPLAWAISKCGLASSNYTGKTN